jgi:diacylglycerol kinase (ATP)
MTKRTFTAIVNPTAGNSGSGAAAALLPVARLLREAGADVTVEYSRGLEHAATLAREAAGRGHVVLGVGGDGMVGCVGGAVAGTDAIFGIVPAGRGNDFAHRLGIGDDPGELAALLLDAEPRAVDAIEVERAGGDRIAVLGSVYTGVDAVANRNANRARLLRGASAYYVSTLRAVATWRPAAYRVTVDGDVHELSGYTVVAANIASYGAGRHIAPDARVDDGLLDVVFIKHVPKPMFFPVMKELETGVHIRRPQVEVVRGREVRVEADRDLPYGADGEVIGTLPVTARVLPGALHVLA